VHGRRIRTTLLVACVFVAGIAGAPGVEAKKPKIVTVQCATNPGALIDKPGVYKVRRAVGDCAVAHLIEITSSKVTLDLQGRVLKGDGAICEAGVFIENSLKKVKVRNGTLTNCLIGVASQAQGTVIERVTTVDNDTGIDGHNDAFRGNLVAFSGFTGVGVDSGGSVIGNTIVNNARSGLEGLGDTKIRGNRFLANGRHGLIVGSGDTVQKNSFIGNALSGIQAFENASISKNTVIGNAPSGAPEAGIRLMELNNVASKNKVVGNGGAGILAEMNSTTLSGNSTHGNAEDGMVILADSTASGNRSNGNLGRGLTAANGNLVQKNLVNGNVDLGIYHAVNPQGPLGTNKALHNDGMTQCDPSDLCVAGTPPKGTAIFNSGACIGGTKEIDTPGNYYLAQAIENCTANPAISITSPDVTLNLNGNRVDGIGGLTTGIDVGAGLSNVTIRNGTVSGFFIGFSIGGTNTRLENVVATNNFSGVGGNAGATIADSFLVRNGLGASINEDVHIHRTTVVGNPNGGIYAPVGQATLSSNLITGNGMFGIDADGGDNTISSNKVLANDGPGIVVAGANVLSKNVASANNGNGIDTGTGSSVTKNTAVGNTLTGIASDPTSVVTKNRAFGNRQHGFDAQGPSTFISNVASGNLVNGFDGTGPVTFNKNVANGNGARGIDSDMGTFGSKNKAKDNGLSPQCIPDIC
jgi:parallel beta-helix repeat protein